MDHRTMRIRTWSLFLVTLLALVYLVSCQRRPRAEVASLNCTDHLKEIDRCSSQATFSFTSPLNPYADSRVALKGACERIELGVKCLRNQGKCLKPLPRRIVGAYTMARLKHSKKICSNLDDKKAADFWKAAQCMKTKGKTAIMSQREKDLINAIKTVADNSSLPFDSRFHQACCAASAYKTKVLIDIRPECEQFSETMEEMINSMIGELLEAACPEERRLNQICSTIIISKPSAWKPASLTSVALDLIISLAKDPESD